MRPTSSLLSEAVFHVLTSSPYSSSTFIFVYCRPCVLLRVSADLESRANSLRKEALQCVTIALAGSDTRKLWELLVAYFGANHTGTEDDPWDFLDAAPKIPDPLPLMDTDTETDVASVQSAPAASWFHW